jgi:ribonuclease HI
VIIYCDGACSPNPGVGGWGAILIAPGNGGRRKELSGSAPETTNNRMELTGALRALEALKTPCRVAVYTDSRYLRDAFGKGWLDKWQRNGWKTASKAAVVNVDLWRELLAAARPHEIAWHWVEGHADNPENNRADELAVAARRALGSSV